MKTMRKSILLMVLLLAAALSGCGKKEITGEDKSNDRRVITDESKKAEASAKEVHTRVTFINDTGIDIYYLYASDTDDWEEDILDVDVLEYGQAFEVDFIHTSDQTVWDFRIEDLDENYLEFYDLDFDEYGDDGIAVTLNADGTADIADGADNYELPQLAPDSAYMYSPLLDQYYDLLASGETVQRNEAFEELADSDLLISYSLGVDLNTVGYAFFDLDGNGTDELFIGFTQGGALTLEGNINYGVFMNAYMVDAQDRIVSIANSGRSAYYYLCTDGMIGRYAESIPFSESYEFFHMEDGLYSQGLLTNNIDAGEWSVSSEGQSMELSVYEAEDIINTHVPMQITFTPFSQYK